LPFVQSSVAEPAIVSVSSPVAASKLAPTVFASMKSYWPFQKCFSARSRCSPARLASAVSVPSASSPRKINCTSAGAGAAMPALASIRMEVSRFGMARGGGMSRTSVA
jgi:hypothetical protein